MKYYIIYLLKGKVKDISSFCSEEYIDYQIQLDNDNFRLINYFVTDFDEIQTLHVVT